MGFVLDVVPNHMGVEPERNHWWRDVLENGPSSIYARYFDIDWTPIKPELTDKVLLPILGDQYGAVLERGELQLGFREGALHLHYFDRVLPLNPRRSVVLLKHDVERLREKLGDEDPHLREFLSIVTALQNLPPATERDPDKMIERHREKEVARERLMRLAESSADVREHIERAIAVWNGTPATRAASIGCTRCSTSRTTGWPTGGRRRTKSTTAASSTSTNWPACAWKIRRCSRPRTA